MDKLISFFFELLKNKLAGLMVPKVEKNRVWVIVQPDFYCFLLEHVTVSIYVLYLVVGELNLLEIGAVYQRIILNYIF